MVTFSISVLTADCCFLFLRAATRLRDDDSTFECFTIECLTLWAEIPGWVENLRKCRGV